MRPDYKPNVTRDPASAFGSTYWTPERMASGHRYQWYAYRRAARLARTARVRTVVDVGCGVGTKLDEFFGDGFNVFGLDQPFEVEKARELGLRGTFLPSDIEHDDPPSGVPHPADFIIASDIIEHFVDPDRLIAYIRRLCGPTTLVVITTPERLALYGASNVTPENTKHVREWSFDELEHYVNGSGFDVREHRRLLPFKLAADKMTLEWAGSRARRGRHFRTNQYLVCQPKP
jgi:2-polyprenyl-3-methyl-5-hydroxy-6-metoxy-1,4-benzoquinol methylase